MMRRGFRGSLLLAGILTLWAASASAQAIGSIFGKVTDESGAVLPGVTVTVTGPTLQQPLVAVTTGTGAYQFPNVPIGKFTVTFEMSGFKKVTRPDVVIESGFNAGIDAKLELGALTEEVTVSGASPIVDLKRTTTGSVFTADVLEKIPSSRDPWQIIGMTPGVRAGLNVGGSTSGQQVGLELARHGGQRPVEPRRRVDHRPVVELLAGLLQLRFARADSGQQRRRRRLRAVERPGHQPRDQERQQRVQGHGDGHVLERQHAGQQRRRRSCSPPGRTASSRARRSRRSPSTRSNTAGPS